MTGKRPNPHFRSPDPSGSRERPASPNRRGRALHILENLQLTLNHWLQLAALRYDPDPEIAARAGAVATFSSNFGNSGLAASRRDTNLVRGPFRDVPSGITGRN
jgi:hypothetical protein